MDILRTQFGEEGYYDSIELRAPAHALGRHSSNWIPYGSKLLRAFKGLSEAGAGSRTMFPFRNGWAGLDDTTGPGSTGRGSVFSGFFGMCVYAGSGQLIIDGEEVSGAIASSIVRILLRWNGSYTATESGPFTVGITEPSAPIASATASASSLVPNLTGSLSFKIAWYRTTTGGRSRSSVNSATVVFNGNAPVLLIPEAPTGATHLAIFTPKIGEAQRGLHYRMVRPNPKGTQADESLEFRVVDIERSVSVTLAGAACTAAAGTFSAADVGKRLDHVSGTGDVTDPTTIITFTDDANVILSQAALADGDMEGKLIAYEGGVDRQILLQYAESDLSDEVAWIEDFVPPPVSHVADLDKVWVYFTGGDASTNVSDVAGSIMQFSNRNFPESVNPLWRLYLPDSVVDVISRGLDSYMFVALKTMILAFQYVETIGDAAPAAGMIVLPRIGIASPTNWCLGSRALYIFANDGNLLRVSGGGEVDFAFATPIKNLLQTFTNREDVVLQHDGKSSIAILYGNIAVAYNEETAQWSTRLRLGDWAPGNICAAVATDGGLIVTMDDPEGEGRTAYAFDKETDSTYAIAATDYMAVDERFPAIISDIFANLKTDTPNSTVYLTLHRNYEPISIIGSISNVSNAISDARVTCSSIVFTSEHIGYYVVVQGISDDDAYSGAGFWGGRICSIVSDHVALISPFTDTNMLRPTHTEAPGEIEDTVILFAKRAFRVKPEKTGIIEIVNQTINQSGCYAQAIAVSMMTVHEGNAQPLNSVIGGDVDTVYRGQIKP